MGSSKPLHVDVQVPPECGVQSLPLHGSVTSAMRIEIATLSPVLYEVVCLACVHHVANPFVFTWQVTDRLLPDIAPLLSPTGVFYLVVLPDSKPGA